jgi:hypothetical protein
MVKRSVAQLEKAAELRGVAGTLNSMHGPAMMPSKRLNLMGVTETP